MDILLLLIDLTVYIEKKKKIERVRELNTKKYSVNIFFCRRRRCWLEFNFDFPEIFLLLLLLLLPTVRASFLFIFS